MTQIKKGSFLLTCMNMCIAFSSGETTKLIALGGKKAKMLNIILKILRHTNIFVTV